MKGFSSNVFIAHKNFKAFVQKELLYFETKWLDEKKSEGKNSILASEITKAHIIIYTLKYFQSTQQNLLITGFEYN